MTEIRMTPAGDGTAVKQASPVSGLPINFREVGGIVTSDGRRVRSGLLFRSAEPICSAEAARALAEAGVRFICDFRSAYERAGDEAAHSGAAGIDYRAPNSGRPLGDPTVALRRCTIDAETTLAVMHEVYTHIPRDQAPAYRGLFAQLLRGNLPLLIHCASGKDRTGVFIALLLHVLGVPRAAIEADYARSNDAIEGIAAAFRGHVRHAELIAAPDAVWWPLMRSEVSYLRRMFSSLEDEHGSVDAYLASLGVGVDEAERLRARLLL